MNIKELHFKEYSGEDFPEYFEYDDKEDEFVEFYKDDAKRLQDESVVQVYNVYLDEKLVGYFAYTLSEIKYTALKVEDKFALYSHPALKLGRLLVCKSERGRNIGRNILAYLLAKAVTLTSQLPLRFIIVDALPDAVNFYKKNGFVETSVKRGNKRNHTLMYIDIKKHT